MAKIKLVEKNGREGKSGSLEINSGYDAYYELALPSRRAVFVYL